MLPVTIFKKLNLLSVNKSKIVKTLHSSGTSGQKTSKIYLDQKKCEISSSFKGEVFFN